MSLSFHQEFLQQRHIICHSLQLSVPCVHISFFLRELSDLLSLHNQIFHRRFYFSVFEITCRDNWDTKRPWHWLTPVRCLFTARDTSKPWARYEHLTCPGTFKTNDKPKFSVRKRSGTGPCTILHVLKYRKCLFDFGSALIRNYSQYESRSLLWIAEHGWPFFGVAVLCESNLYTI